MDTDNDNAAVGARMPTDRLDVSIVPAGVLSSSSAGLVGVLPAGTPSESTTAVDLEDAIGAGSVGGSVAAADSLFSCETVASEGCLAVVVLDEEVLASFSLMLSHSVEARRVFAEVLMRMPPEEVTSPVTRLLALDPLMDTAPVAEEMEDGEHSGLSRNLLCFLLLLSKKRKVDLVVTPPKIEGNLPLAVPLNADDSWDKDDVSLARRKKVIGRKFRVIHEDSDKGITGDEESQTELAFRLSASGARTVLTSTSRRKAKLKSSPCEVPAIRQRKKKATPSPKGPKRASTAEPEHDLVVDLVMDSLTASGLRAQATEWLQEVDDMLRKCSNI